MSELNATQLLHQVENWGYYLLPKSHSHSPGYTGLLVAIRERPTKKHFDPERISLQVLDEQGVPQGMTFHLKWHLTKSRRVCAGRVILRDREEKEIEFYTFGGSCESVSVSGETVYSLRSTAPILQLTEKGESLSDLLAGEMEILIAKQHVRWGEDDEGYGRQLAQIEPVQLYVMSISSLLVRTRREGGWRKEVVEVNTMLLEERNWLEEVGQWPDRPPQPEELLSPR